MGRSKIEKEKALEELELTEKKIELRQGLPHLYGWKFYKWSRLFFESRNRYNFVCAGNQISKSSTQIRKVIHWATEKDLWPELWRTKPTQFWYFYPSWDLVESEFYTKWEAEFLPSGNYKKSEKYGWSITKKNGIPIAIHFTSGVTVYFKTYAQNPEVFQAGSVYGVFCDEEMPETIYDELNARMIATDGYFHMVCTPTQGYDLWKSTFEGQGDQEKFPGALKLNVSMFDCMFYEDGSPSTWTKEKIQIFINSCKSDAEVQRRVYGKFVVDSGRKYSAFDRTRNTAPGHPVPKDWKIYSGTDPGGGGDGHPSAICFVAVSPDYKTGRVIRCWRGDGIITTASDTLQKYLELRGSWIMTGQYYDYHAKDFFTIATRIGEAFMPAEKGHDIGETILNTLFRNSMLTIYSNDVEAEKLIRELTMLLVTTDKRQARDDLTDALRYAVTKIPWDWEAIQGEKPIEPAHLKTQSELRRELLLNEDIRKEQMQLEDEIEAWNELYGS